MDSGQVVVARAAGEVSSVTGRDVTILEEDNSRRVYSLRKFNRSNQSTCIDQRPVVRKGQWVREGTVLADSSSTEVGELALGQNVLVAFMSWDGGNYEDAILISERMVMEDKYSSCLLYTSDAADERSSVDLGSRRIIKKKKQRK